MISGFRTPSLVLLAPFELQNKPEKNNGADTSRKSGSRGTALIFLIYMKSQDSQGFFFCLKECDHDISKGVISRPQNLLINKRQRKKKLK